MNEKVKISFDVDGTLIPLPREESFVWVEYNNRFQRNPNYSEEIKAFAKEKSMDNSIETFIITRRFGSCEESRQQVFKLAEEIGVKPENVFFLRHALKFGKINELGINVHIDDDAINDIPSINSMTKCRAIFCAHIAWKDTFEGAIKYFKEELRIK